jgi:hypothetical protein
VQKLFTDKLSMTLPVLLVGMLLCVSMQGMAQKRSAKQERITVKDVPDEYKHGKKNITPHKRKKLQTKDFINRRKTYRDKMTKREKRQIDKIIGIDRKAERKKQRKEMREKKQIAKAEKKLRKKHLALQTPEVRKRMKKNLKKTKKDFIDLQQRKRKIKNPYNQEPGKPLH